MYDFWRYLLDRNVDYDVDDDNDGDEDEIDDDGEGSDCLNLNQKGKKIILQDVEVPAHFTHQATSGCLTINMTPRSLPLHLTFRRL